MLYDVSVAAIIVLGIDSVKDDHSEQSGSKGFHRRSPARIENFAILVTTCGLNADASPALDDLDAYASREWRDSETAIGQVKRQAIVRSSACPS